MSNEQTTENTGNTERIITAMLTRAEIEALNVTAARLGMTSPEMLSRALMAEIVTTLMTFATIATPFCLMA